MSKSSFTINTKITKELKTLLEEIASTHCDGNLSMLLKACVMAFITRYEMLSERMDEDIFGYSLLGETPSLPKGSRLVKVGVKIDNSYKDFLERFIMYRYNGSTSNFLRAAINFKLAISRIEIPQ